MMFKIFLIAGSDVGVGTGVFVGKMSDNVPAANVEEQSASQIINTLITYPPLLVIEHPALSL